MNARMLLGLVALFSGATAVPVSLWWSATERHTQSAADYIKANATPSDLILIDARLETGAANGAGLMRPFGPLQVAVVTPGGMLPDLSTFPQSRVFLVGEFTPEELGLSQVERVHPKVQLATVTHSGVPVVSLMDSLRPTVERDGVKTPCKAHHPSGGVRCGNQQWQYVGPVVLTAKGKGVSCLWSHPISGASLIITIPAHHGKVDLWLQFGDEALKDPPHPPVDATLLSDGKVLQQVACTNTGSGRCSIQADVDEDTHEVQLVISTSDAARQVNCLGGEVPWP